MENFTFRGTRATFTFPNHIYPEKFEIAFAKLLPKSVSIKMKILHEIGKSDYKHTHVVFLLSKRVKLTSAKKWRQFVADTGKFDSKPISTDLHFQNAIKYDESTAKSKTKENSWVVFDTIGKWSPQIPFHEQVLKFLSEAQSWSEVLTSKKYSEYLATKLKWAHQVYQYYRNQIPFEFKSGKPFEWQAQIIDFLKKPCTDDRTVHWIYDDIGGNGKSQLTNYLLANHKAFLVNAGKTTDIAHAYDNEPIVIFDLPRDTEEYCPYRAIEGFKDGRFFSPKYDSCMKRFIPPHVIVFANYRPIVKGKLSEDRWDIITLEDRELEHNLTTHEERKKKSMGCPNSIKTPPGKKGKTESKFTLKDLKPSIPNGAEISPPQKLQMETTETSCRHSCKNSPQNRQVSNTKTRRTKIFS